MNLLRNWSSIGPYSRIEMIDSLSSAELGTLLSYASIAAQLTVMNIGSTICDKVGANFVGVKRSFAANPRIDDSFIRSRSGSGYGGLHLKKDIAYLAYLCDCVGLRDEMDFFNQLIKLKRRKMDELVETILCKIGSSKRIPIYGFSNRVDTDDIRESLAIDIGTSLLKVHDVRLVVYDPCVPTQKIMSSFPAKFNSRVEVLENAREVWANTEAVIFLNEWPEFKTMLQLYLEPMLSVMKGPRFIFNCCDLIDDTVDISQAVKSYNTVIYKLGKPF